MSVRKLSDAVAERTEVDATVCVIGAGIAGLFAARRLAAQGHRVVVVESGLENFDRAIHELNRVEDPHGHFSQAVDGRFRGLGGSSSQWGGRMIPMTSHDMSRRDYIGLDAWPIDIGDLARHRREIEDVFVVDHETFEEDVLARLDRRGRIRRSDADFTLRYPKWPTFRRCNLAGQFRDEIHNWPKLEIWLGATVCDFELDTDGGALTAVVARDFAGRVLRVSARQFVFAAGAVESTRLLLQLDAASSGRAFARCDVLGRYFNDHLGSPVGYLAPVDWPTTIRWFGYYFIAATRRNLHIETTPAAQEADRVPSAFAQVFLLPPDKSGLNVVKNVLRGLQRGVIDAHPRDALYLLKDAWPMLQTGYWRYVRNQLFIPKNMPLSLNIWAEQAPRRDNRITLSERRDRLGNPLARVEWTTSQDDERTFRACVARLAGYWERAGLVRACPIVWSDTARDPDCALAAKAQDLGHPSGSARMGRDPAESVVGPDLACHHVANAWVAGAATFPSMGSANPTYTIIQLALRAADGVAKRLTGLAA